VLLGLDLETLGELIVQTTKDAVAPLHARIEALDAELVRVKAAAPAVPDQSALMARLEAVEAKAAVPGPPGPVGERGPAGPAGAPGLPGEKGLDGAVGVGIVGPAGPEGTPGRDGRDGMAGVPGPIGEKGLDGAAGLNGKDGRDGLDGTLEGLVVEQLDARRVAFKRANGDTLGTAVFPIVLDCGVYREGQAYEKGDGVSFAGSFWIAQGETKEKPGDGVTGWRLAVKRGRDGKEGKPGPVGERGMKGERGVPGMDYR